MMLTLFLTKKLRKTAMENNKAKTAPNTMEYPVDFSSLEMMNPDRIGPTIPAQWMIKIPQNPLKKSLGFRVQLFQKSRHYRQASKPITDS